MKKPWQIWTLFALCLLVVVPAMVWLTMEAVKLDRIRETDHAQTELARREVELQEKINSAMWRMDGFLTSLIAKEATRPWYLYQSFYDVSPMAAVDPLAPATKQSTMSCYRQASPLMLQQSEFVVLHFQIGSDDRVTSPQMPSGRERLQAASCGVTESCFDSYAERMKEVESDIDFDSMLTQCSTMMLPEISLSTPQQTLNAVDWQANNSQLESLPPFSLNSPNQSGDEQVELVSPLQQSMMANNNPALQVYRGQVPQNEPDISFPSQEQQTRGKPNKQSGMKQQVQQTRNTNRGNVEYNMRRKSTEQYAMNEWASNAILEPQMAGAIAASSKVREGVMQPLWMGDRLFLARRVTLEKEQVVQCCWLNWQRIAEALKSEVNDILPKMEFKPIRQNDPIRWDQAMANLPVQLVLDRESMIQQMAPLAALETVPKRSGIKFALLLAWCGLAFTTFAGAFLLHGVMKLSERRGAFVSAVSHELRTPLTTFRMYAEMLAEKMVPEEKRQHYADTLKVEAERLSHLVENVLQFARLEKTNQKSRTEQVTLDEMLERFGDRLQGRAERAQMKLVNSIPDSVMKQSVETDPAAIEQILFNLVDNACKYAATAEDRRIELRGRVAGNQLCVAVQDFGPGVAVEHRKRMFLPFRKSDQESADTAQGVGLGLALCRRMAKSLGGSLQFVESGAGARMELRIPV